jgi:hypothetical protein
MKSLYYRSAIILLFITAILLTGQKAHAQSNIEGTISDRDSNPLVGATVTIKGTNNYAVADSNGKFKISSQEKLPFSLLVRALGYTTQEVEVYELSGESFEVSLLEDNILNGVNI